MGVSLDRALLRAFWISDDYDLYEFLGAVNYAIVCAIEDVKIFRNYIWNRHDVEDEYEMQDFLPGDWEKFIKKAYKNMRFEMQ